MIMQPILTPNTRMKVYWNPDQLSNSYGYILADLEINYLKPQAQGYTFGYGGYSIQLNLTKDKATKLATKCLIGGIARATVVLDYKYIGGLTE